MYSLPSLLLLSAILIPGPVEEGVKRAPPGQVVIIKETRSRGDEDDEPVVPRRVLTQVKSSPSKVVAMTRVPVSTLEHGLDLLPKSLKPTITAAAEADGWFFYDTIHVPKDESGRPMPLFIRGYAVQRGSQKVVEFSVW